MDSLNPLVSASELDAAATRIASHITATPLIRAPELAAPGWDEVSLKLESLQATGTFKVRGAANKILAAAETSRRAGVVTFSTGNHGRAVAHIAQSLGIPAVIFLGRDTAREKVDALTECGAELRVEGESQAEAGRLAESYALQSGRELVHPFDDPLVIAGQGTVGLEILDSGCEPDAILVPVGGGGLLGGIGAAVAARAARSRVIGVVADSCRSMYESHKAGRPVECVDGATLADSLRGGIGDHNRYTLPHARALVDEIVCVQEEEIGAAMSYALRRLGLVLEGAGAAPIAALLSGRATCSGGHVVAIASGRNVAIERLVEVDARYGPAPR